LLEVGKREAGVYDTGSMYRLGSFLPVAILACVPSCGRTSLGTVAAGANGATTLGGVTATGGVLAAGGMSGEAGAAARPGTAPLLRTLGAGLVGASLAVAVTGTVVWIQQESGSYGTFNSGSTGPGLLIGGVVGMLAGSALIYWTASKESAITVGLNGRGPVVGGAF
jgi:hypothetical protein